MSAGGQLPFAFPQRPALGREDFLVVPSNSLAVDWIDRWPDWPAFALALHGPAGSGKSHLLEVWRERSDAQILEADALFTAEPFDLIERTLESETPALALDGLGPAHCRGGAVSERLLRLYNMMREARGSLLTASREPPARLPAVLRDLSSRLASMPSIAICAPEEDLVAAVLVKHFDDRQVTVPPEVITYLLPRMERSLGSAAQLAEILDRAALSDGRAITVPFVRRVLKDLAEREAEPAETESSGQQREERSEEGV
jgi:chromosomal replication initiation ATPase DnaA